MYKMVTFCIQPYIFCMDFVYIMYTRVLFITFISLTSLVRPSFKLCRPSEYRDAVLSSSELPDSSSVSDGEPTLWSWIIRANNSLIPNFDPGSESESESASDRDSESESLWLAAAAALRKTGATLRALAPGGREKTCLNWSWPELLSSDKWDFPAWILKLRKEVNDFGQQNCSPVSGLTKGTVRC